MIVSLCFLTIARRRYVIDTEQAGQWSGPVKDSGQGPYGKGQWSGPLQRYGAHVIMALCIAMASTSVAEYMMRRLQLTLPSSFILNGALIFWLQ